MLILRTPPLEPLRLPDGGDPPPPSPVDIVLIRPDGAHLYPRDGGWSAPRTLPEPHQPRPADLPVLADGVDLAGWIAAYGDDAVTPLPLRPDQLLLLAEAERCVLRDMESLNFADAIDAQTDLQDVCLRLHYQFDLHADEDPHATVVFDARTHRFYLLRKN